MMHLDCPNCFAFSAEDICNHHLSDHNYYAICQVIVILFIHNYRVRHIRYLWLQLLLNSENENPFPGGFLYDVPANIEQQYPDIEHLLQQCAIPDSANSRIFFGQRLKALLDTILRELPQHEYNIK